MADVVDLAHFKEEQSPHASGPAQCLGCGHRWVAVAPLGVTALECPNCNTDRGVFRSLFGGCWAWVCVCGNDAYLLSPTHAACLLCGRRVQYTELMP